MFFRPYRNDDREKRYQTWQRNEEKSCNRLQIPRLNAPHGARGVADDASRRHSNGASTPFPGSRSSTTTAPPLPRPSPQTRQRYHRCGATKRENCRRGSKTSSHSLRRFSGCAGAPPDSASPFNAVPAPTFLDSLRYFVALSHYFLFTFLSDNIRPWALHVSVRIYSTTLPLHSLSFHKSDFTKNNWLRLCFSLFFFYHDRESNV